MVEQGRPTNHNGTNIDVPAGYAAGNTTVHGVRLLNASLNSGDSLMRIRGVSRANISYDGVNIAGSALTSTTGEIVVEGLAEQSGRRGVTIESGSNISSTNGNISIGGTLNAQSAYTALSVNGAEIKATNGELNLTSTNSADVDNAYTGIGLNDAKVLSETGEINLIANGSRIWTGGTSYLGTGPGESTSSANVTIRVDRLALDGNMRIAATGSLVIEPITQNYRGAGTLFFMDSTVQVFDFSNTRIGKTGTVATQTLTPTTIASLIRVNGPIELNAGSLTLTNTLESISESAQISINSVTGFTGNSDIVTNNGDVLVRADSIGLGASATINAGTGAVDLGSASSGTGIRILSATDKSSAATTTLNIATEDLDKVTAGKLRIGAANAGNITIESPLVRDQAGSNTLRLRTAGSVANTDGNNLSVSNLAVQAGGSIRLDSDYSSATPSLLALNSGNLSAGNVQFSQMSGDYTPAEVDGVTPVFGVAVSARASQVPVTEPTAVYQNAEVNPAPQISLIDAYAQTLNARNTLASNYQVQATASAQAQLSGVTVSSVAGGFAQFTGLRFLGAQGQYPVTFEVLSNGVLVDSVVTGDNYELISSQPSSLNINWSNRWGSAGGALFQTPTISIIDAGGNTIKVAPHDTATVSATITGPRGQILGGGQVAATGGVASFSNLVIAGSVGVNYTVEFSVVIQGSTESTTISAAVNNFQLQPGTPSSLRVAQQPSNIVAGISFSPEVSIELIDAYSNVVTSNNDFELRPVFVKADGTESISATITASAGVLAFEDLTGTNAGTFRIRFEDTSTSPLASVTSSQFVVSPATPHSLEWDVQPSDVVARAVMTSPRLKILDVYGNHVAGDSLTTARLRVIDSASAEATPNFANRYNQAGLWWLHHLRQPRSRSPCRYLPPRGNGSHLLGCCSCWQHWMATPTPLKSPLVQLLL